MNNESEYDYYKSIICPSSLSMPYDCSEYLVGYLDAAPIPDVMTKLLVRLKV